MPGNHGGARPGAGRPANLERHSEKIASFTDECAGHLKPAFWRLWELIEGAVRIEEEFVPAGVLTRKDLARDDDGSIVLDSKLKPTVIQVLMFPDLPADQPILIKQKRTTFAPDPKAIELLFDRAIGRAHAEPEVPTDILEIRGALMGALDAMAARKAAGPTDDTPPPMPATAQAPADDGADDDDDL